jgi:hypothetical protein
LRLIDLPMSNCKKFAPFAAATLLAALLAGCGAGAGGSSDDKMARFLVAPDKFVIYTCPEMAEKAQELTARERELEQLIAKAGQSTDGRLVSSMAYRPDYITVRGEMNELQKAAATKNCKLPDAAGPRDPSSAAAPR